MVMLVLGIMISELQAQLFIEKINPNNLKYCHAMKDHRKGIRKTPSGEKAVRGH